MKQLAHGENNVLNLTKGPRYWFTLISKFLIGQGGIQAINIICGVLILRYLSIEEYALYTIASSLFVIGSIGSDFGLAQGVNTLGAKLVEDSAKLGILYASAYRYRKILYPLAMTAVLVVSVYVIYGRSWSILNIGLVICTIFLSIWYQQSLALKKSILNVYHDSNGLFKAGLAESVTRLMAISTCIFFPYAIVALSVNFFGIIVSHYVLVKRCSRFIKLDEAPNYMQSTQLKKFVMPLAPALIYYMVQGQISVVLLGLYGMTAAVAEVGALGRLGQVVGLLIMLNSFIILPHFSRISEKKSYLNHFKVIIFILSILCLIGMTSAYLIPNWWLAVLGKKYSGLASNLPMAVLGPFLTLVGATLYSMVIARNETNGQSWYIFLGLASQIIFIFLFDVKSTQSALLLNMLPAIAYICVQGILIRRLLVNWCSKK